MKVTIARVVDESCLFATLDCNGAEVVVEAELIPGMSPEICEITWGKTGENALPELIEDLDEIRAILRAAASEVANS